MERNVIPLKEDCSFEILQLSDGDEDLVQEATNPEDDNEFVVKENKCTDSSDISFNKWKSQETNSATKPIGITSCSFSALSMVSLKDPITFYSTDAKDIENLARDYPVIRSKHDKTMPSYRDKNSETNSALFLKSEPIFDCIPREKFQRVSESSSNIQVISTERLSCCQFQTQDDSLEFSNYGNKDSVQEEYSSWVSNNDQCANGAQSEGIVCEEMVDDKDTPEFLRRANCNRKFCQIVDNGIQFCSWIRNRPSVKRFVKKAKESFKSIASTVELEINQILGSENPLRLSIISDVSSAQAIEEAFVEVFRGHVLASSINVDLDTIPSLPIGNSAGLQAAEMKILYARENNLALNGSVVVSTSIMLQETVLQRWQMMTVICLDDPNLPMQLHNFTETTPIPNQYVMEAERQTLPNYHLRDYGLAVDMKQAIVGITKMKLEDPQEFLTGVSHSSTVKSAALILAGLYKKYVIK